MTAPFQLFDALDPATEAALRASIERFGVLVPVVRDQHGNTIDGHHRARIAGEMGVQFRVDVVAVADEDEARDIARTLNADRRQLDPEHRKQVVAVLATQVDERGIGVHTPEAIAGALGVDRKTVRNDLAELGTDPKLPTHRRGLDGKVRSSRRPPVVAAKNEREAERAQVALGDLGDAAPSRVLDVKRAERIAREHAAEQRRAEPVEPVTVEHGIDIRHGDFRDALADIEHGTVDAIITDPPYIREMFAYGEGLYALGAMAADILKPTGVLAVMFGTGTIPEAVAALSQSMSFHWCCAWLTPGPRARMHHAKVGTGWKPIYLYTRPDGDPGRWLLDDVITSARDDKDHHHWGQDVAGFTTLVERLTEPGALVIDPFLGGGTTAVACQDTGRRFIGCDIDAAAVTTARERTA